MKKFRKWSIHTAAILGFSASTHALASASSGPTPITSDALSGRWELKCQPSPDNEGDEDDAFLSGTVTFSDGDFVMDVSVYEDAACTVKEDNSKRNGTYTIGGNHGDGQKVDMTENFTVYGTFKIDGLTLWLSDLVGSEADRPTTYPLRLEKVKP